MADASALRERVRTYNRTVFEEAVRLLMDELNVVVPVGATGDTRRGLTSTPGGGGDHMTAQIQSASPHGDYVEEGTDPHVIEPRNGKVLRFLAGSGRISQPSPNQRIATRGDGVVFTKVVHHPGTPPRPWFRPVVERWPEFLQRAEALAA